VMSLSYFSPVRPLNKDITAVAGLGIDISRPERGSDQDDKDRAASRR
jgi:hypothetical protein